jgi:hypothetical protein
MTLFGQGSRQDGRLSASDLRSCLCEFDKYERGRLGEGKPKRRFVPKLLG